MSDYTVARSARVPASVDVWYQYDGVDQYVVSLSDEDGEIRCLGGDADLAEAWTLACQAADDYGVPAHELDRAGQVVDTYQPERG